MAKQDYKKIKSKTLFLIVFLGIMQLICGYITSLFYVVIGMSTYEALLLSQGLFAGVFLFIGGMRLSKKTGIFFIKYIGAIYLGVLSLLTTIVSISWGLYIMAISAESIVGFTLIATIILTIWALILGRGLPVVKNISLHSAHQYTRIVQLTDLHFNGIKSPKWTQALVRKINDLQPDIVVITGDIIEVDPEHLTQHATALKKINCKNKFAVSGNHDLYTGYSQFIEFLRSSTFKCLDFDAAIIKKQNNKIIHVIGLPDDALNDHATTDFITHKIQSLQSESCYNVLLRHKPIYFKESTALGINLQLSGHTHFGQLPPITALIRLFFTYACGLYQYKKAFIYTAPGTSTWGPPMRLFQPSEISVFDV